MSIVGDMLLEAFGGAVIGVLAAIALFYLGEMRKRWK
jgi:hypothetical protein